VERKDTEPGCDILDRYDVHCLEPGHVDGSDAADRARQGGIRRRVAAELDGHLRLGRCGRLATGVRPAEPGAQHDSVRDAAA